MEYTTEAILKSVLIDFMLLEMNRNQWISGIVENTDKIWFAKCLAVTETEKETASIVF